ncbi:NfeD family protein [Actinokineospora bangkokensis]|uniref:NfeD-like C-terminal domain-containing protein n=1 Tax=Actinokineospora bangkokensis TaxID=1193682 RepID=A0A1Q9LP31_9PSEU|nr:NfeD family protein [Actinokineospora bangkokensis]OLR93807.1 hypothetical protein BJP25_16370 [Actinokineospora bangkokensis]
MAALVWVIAGIALVVAEALSGDLVLLMLGVAALLGGGAEALFGSTLVSAAVFAASALGLLAAARPALRHRLTTRHVTDNAAALLGAPATVLSTVDAHGGLVRLNGQEWTARSMDPEQVLTPGTAVTVVQIAGATAVVWADHPPGLPPGPDGD